MQTKEGVKVVGNISSSYLQEKVKFGFTDLIGSTKSEKVFQIMSDLRFLLI